MSKRINPAWKADLLLKLNRSEPLDTPAATAEELKFLARQLDRAHRPFKVVLREGVRHIVS